jgi:uncharacterized repeat protein (TIGR03809 family)
MTQRSELARVRAIVARWCDLAERRLEHLNELFESGRWRRYHSEVAFLENIREAKAAVDTWRDLLSREASLDNSAIDVSWLGRGRWTLPALRLEVHPARTPAEPLRPDAPEATEVPVALESQLVASDAAPSTPDIPISEQAPLPAPDLAVMRERYPLLRSTL